MAKIPKEKRPPRTIKEKKFAILYAKTGNATESASIAYDVSSRASAASIGEENLRKLDFTDILEKYGVSDDKMAEVLIEGLEANRVISAVAGTEANGGTVDFVDVPDHQTRHRFLETALKLKDKFPSAKVEGTVKIEISNLDDV